MATTVAASRLAVQQAIINVLKTIPGVQDDKVFTEYQPIASPQEFVETLVGDDVTTDQTIQMILVRRVRTIPYPDLDTLNCHKGFAHHFRIELWIGYQFEKSEARFQALVDAILDAFAFQRSLGGWSTETMLQLEDEITQDYLGDYFVHYARFMVESLDVVEGSPT